MIPGRLSQQAVELIVGNAPLPARVAQQVVEVLMTWTALSPTVIVGAGISQGVLEVVLKDTNLTTAPYDAAVIANSPYLYWKLNEASGTPQDSSGNARHAIGTYGTVALGTAGPPGNFNGDTCAGFTAAGFIYRDGTGNDWLNPPCTLECLVSRDPLDSNGAYGGSRIFSSERDDFGGAWGPGFTGTTSGEAVLHSFSSRNDTGDIVTNNQWYHLVWVYDGVSATWKCYLDGAKIYDNAGFGSGRRSFGPFRVGGFGNTSISNIQAPFYGKVSRVALYSSALTEAQIQGHAALFTAASNVNSFKARVAQSVLEAVIKEGNVPVPSTLGTRVYGGVA